jgi:2-(1,2-epoxy-1,2-dihydrophenyl)acetyl-CoA isomerase
VADRGVRTITFSRPHAANAIDLGLARELEAAVGLSIADQSCRLIVLASEGRFFTAGGDVNAMVGADDPAAYIAELAASLHRSVLALAAAEMPTLAVVTGPAAGAGLGFVLNADLVIATPQASFIAAYGDVGLTPDCGVSYLLPRRIGGARASGMLLAGRRLNATDALDWGIVGEVVDDADVRAAIGRVATGVMARTRQSVAETRRLVREATLADYEAHLAEEARSIAAMATREETTEALLRFTRGRGGT